MTFTVVVHCCGAQANKRRRKKQDREIKDRKTKEETTIFFNQLEMSVVGQ